MTANAKYLNKIVYPISLIKVGNNHFNFSLVTEWIRRSTHVSQPPRGRRGRDSHVKVTRILVGKLK